MKLIKVVCRPEKTLELKDALTKLGYHGITFKVNWDLVSKGRRLNRYFVERSTKKG